MRVPIHFILSLSMPRPTSGFSRFARAISHATGTPSAFAIAAAVIVLWAVTGPLFDYSDTWQLIINTSTTIVTFLMVFLIQNSQNRDSAAVQLKLDELIKALDTADNTVLDLEEREEKEIDRRKAAFQRLAQEERAATPEGTTTVAPPQG